MKIKPYLLILVLIFVLGAFLRFYNLSSIPPGPTIDEASIGYNAYSILKTGADEYGTKFPVLLRAFDDWRPALYVYLVIPFVAIFDLSTMSIRLPSVILSIFSIIAVYFLSKYLTKDFKELKFGSLVLDVPLIATFLFAVSPWAIYLSRLGHEVNAAFSFLLFGLVFFFSFLEKEKWNLILASVFFALSFDTYQSTKIIIPLLGLVLLVIFYKKLLKEKLTLLVSLAIGLIIAAPIILSTFDENALIRFKATSLIQNSPDYFEGRAKKSIESRQNGDIVGLILNNQKVSGAILIGNAYLSHFDPIWLASNKGKESFKTPKMGLLYPTEIVFILISLFFFWKSKIPKKNLFVIVSLLFITIIPASLTTGYPHAMRAYSVLPIPQILAAIGLISILSLIKKQKIQIAILFVIFVATTISILGFYKSYYLELPKDLANHFQYGALTAFSEAAKIDKNYQRVVVSNKDRLFESYMFYLYSKKYDPLIYQKMGGTKSGGFAEEHTIDNYVFGEVESKIGKPQLYIINPEEKTSNMKLIKEIRYPNGEVALIIAQTL